MDKRIKLEQPIKTVIRRAKSVYNADITEICRGGLKIVSENKYKKGDRLEFEFPISYKTTNISVIIKAKIKNDYGADTDNLHGYGIKFSRVPFIYFWEKSQIENFVYFQSAPKRK